MTIPKHVEELLEDLAASLQVPPSSYETAERSYKSVAKWLHRPTSSVLRANPNIYVQGSFQLGTAIRPMLDTEDYDVDLVCELSLSKTQLTQAQLKALLGDELHSYAKAHGMKEPEEGRRCWTQDYVDEVQFHMDTLPAIPDAEGQRLLFEQHGFSDEWVDTAIAITDRNDPNFRRFTEVWPHSNPKGYANWFRSRMREVFDAQRQALALEARANVEDIPEYQVRTTLQSTIQILKHHRDVMFSNRVEEKPISIILTTLAAHAYKQEPTISGALFSILDRMDAYIDYSTGVAWIANPTDPAENFADRWQAFPTREEAFREWLDQAREDFAVAAESPNRETANTTLQPRLGRTLIEAASTQRRGSPLTKSVNSVRLLLNPTHRKVPPWNRLDQGQVRIDKATMSRKGFRPEIFRSDGDPLPKHCSLVYEANTDIPRPFEVYWQVVNTGPEAEAANGLRGGFDEGLMSAGKITKKETTLYTGKHSIECFIVKAGYLAARSGQFIVNIQ